MRFEEGPELREELVRQWSVVVAAVDARHDQVYFEVFGPGGRILVTPRLVAVRDAVRAASAAAVIVGSGAGILAAAWPDGKPLPAIATQGAPLIASIALAARSS